MAFRGRGRGRGRGSYGGGFLKAKQVPFELFPEIEELGTAAGVKENIFLANWYSKFQRYWNSSPYYIGDESEGSKKNQTTEIERYSYRNSDKTRSKAPLSHFIRMEPDYVPAELAKGQKEKRGRKRVRWNPESGMQKYFNKLEQEDQGEEAKEDEDEEDDDRHEEEDDEAEYSDDFDYNQNVDFDDDEDDFNMADDNDDEPIF